MKEVERSVAEIQRGEIEKGDCDEWDREHFLGKSFLVPFERSRVYLKAWTK